MRKPLKHLAHVGGLDPYQMVDICPFCGERLERLQGDRLIERPHSIDDCDPDEKLSHVFRIKLPLGYFMQAVRDNDGDWWAYMPETQYHEPYWYLRPITFEELVTLAENAIKYYQHTVTENTRTLGAMKGSVS